MESSSQFFDLQTGIKSDFFNPTNYKNTLEFSEKRYENYIRFCKVIQGYYEDLDGMSKIVLEKLKTPGDNGLQTINQLKQFLIGFMGILQEVATFKRGFYDELGNMQEDPSKKPTYELLINITKYSQAQNKYKEVNLKLKKTEQDIQISYNVLKKQTKEPVLYFDYKYTQAKCASIQQLLKNREELQKQGNTLLQTIYKNASRFEKELMFYRQKILSGKYKIHNKLSQQARGARQCLIQTLLALIQQLHQKQKGFTKLQRDTLKESSLFQKFQRQNKKQHSGSLNITQVIIQATQQYHLMINDLSLALKIITQSFHRVGTNIKQCQDIGKSIVEQFNKLYETDENPTPQIIQTLQLFSYFCQKLSQIPNRIHILDGNLNRLRQNITKHSEITLSLVRCGNMQKSGKGEKGLDQISHLFEQLSYDFLNDIISKIYKQFEDCFGNIKNHFNTKFYKKRKNNIQDSMEISHIQETTVHVQKKPSKKEQWIWKQFRNSEKYARIEDNDESKKEVAKLLKSFTEMKISEEKEIEKYNVSLKFKKETKGVLRILQKSLEFTSSNNLINLKIPYDYIEEVVAGVNIFEKELTVKTSIGNIIFPPFPEISRAQVLIQQQINHQAASKKVVKKLSVELTEEQKKFIQSRKSKVESERMSIEGMAQVASVLLQNTTIDAVYDTVYSDKVFKYKGKEESMFMCYVMKKTGASNYITTPYNPPGPKFYSLQEGRTFINSPLFSERSNNYDVPLPPIPFMPKTCQNTEQVRIYWISNTQLDYVIRSDSRGAPSADSFFLNFVHRVVQKQKNVQVNIYFKCTFVKDTALKGLITSKSLEQATGKNQVLIKQMERIMKTSGTVVAEQQGNKQKASKQQQQPSMSKSRSSGQVKKLQSQNKILIGVLVGVILLNLVLRLF